MKPFSLEHILRTYFSSPYLRDPRSCQVQIRVLRTKFTSELEGLNVKESFYQISVGVDEKTKKYFLSFPEIFEFFDYFSRNRLLVGF